MKDARDDGVDLYWLPLGAGGTARCVQWNGRVFEAVVARRESRDPLDLYHSALEVRLSGERYAIEMAPVWGNRQADRGVVAVGPVGLGSLGRSRYFRYEVRCWRDGVIPDLADAVDSPRRLSADAHRAAQVLARVPGFPTATWGRDELGTGEMWNSNSLTSWLLAVSGHRVDAVEPPPHGRAPGWSAGLVVAARAGFPAPAGR